MTCRVTRNEAGDVVAVVCSEPWGIGSYTYRWTDDAGIPREESGYGFFHSADPHDFYPDRECCTEAEIAAHREACEAWDAAQAEGRP